MCGAGAATAWLCSITEGRGRAVAGGPWNRAVSGGGGVDAGPRRRREGKGRAPLPGGEGTGAVAGRGGEGTGAGAAAAERGEGGDEWG